MAFIKKTSFNFEDVKQEPILSVENDKVSIPLVFTKENGLYHGFVPGILMKDIIDATLDACSKNLLEFIKEDIKNKIRNKFPFPYFPTNEEIKADFDNVVLIKRISVKVKL